MKDFLKRTKNQESVTYSLQMENNLKVTAKITLFKGRGNSKLSIARVLKEFGKTTCLWKYRPTLNFKSKINEGIQNPHQIPFSVFRIVFTDQNN
jgi:hypothetical protein